MNMEHRNSHNNIGSLDIVPENQDDDLHTESIYNFGERQQQHHEDKQVQAIESLRDALKQVLKKNKRIKDGYRKTTLMNKKLTREINVLRANNAKLSSRMSIGGENMDGVDKKMDKNVGKLIAFFSKDKDNESQIIKKEKGGDISTNGSEFSLACEDISIADVSQCTTPNVILLSKIEELQTQLKTAEEERDKARSTLAAINTEIEKCNASDYLSIGNSAKQEENVSHIFDYYSVLSTVRNFTSEFLGMAEDIEAVKGRVKKQQLELLDSVNQIDEVTKEKSDALQNVKNLTNQVEKYESEKQKLKIHPPTKDIVDKIPTDVYIEGSEINRSKIGRKEQGSVANAIRDNFEAEDVPRSKSMNDTSINNISQSWMSDVGSFGSSTLRERRRFPMIQHADTQNNVSVSVASPHSGSSAGGLSTRSGRRRFPLINGDSVNPGSTSRSVASDTDYYTNNRRIQFKEHKRCNSQMNLMQMASMSKSKSRVSAENVEKYKEMNSFTLTKFRNLRRFSTIDTIQEKQQN